MVRPKPLMRLEDYSVFGIRLTPAPEVWEWLKTEILAATGSIHNEDHAHLLDADIQIMWASSSVEKQGRTVLGQAEQVAFRAGGWQKARMEQQIRDWFGEVPAFIITLAADYCAQCSDTDFCALIEHELYHIDQATDKYGQPAFTEEGAPKLKLRGHDVEEFVGVVRRYGATPDVQALVTVADDPAQAYVPIVQAADASTTVHASRLNLPGKDTIFYGAFTSWSPQPVVARGAVMTRTITLALQAPITRYAS